MCFIPVVQAFFDAEKNVKNKNVLRRGGLVKRTRSHGEGGTEKRTQANGRGGRGVKMLRIRERNLAMLPYKLQYLL